MARKKRNEPAHAAPEPTVQSSAVSVPFPIVGIGASAGGIEAFRELLSTLQPGTGMAYVLVLHLPSQHQSTLSEVLARSSPVPLTTVTDGMQIERDHAYVLPAGCDIECIDGALRLTPRIALAGKHRPVDHFFRSLAEVCGHKAIGVVLSGTGSDGTLGISEIKAAGGITFAQDDTAQQSTMPRSAIQTGAIDFVLRPSDIARELARIAAHPIITAPPQPDIAEVPDLGEIIEVIREASGVDFTHYKRNTLYRRNVRRIVLHRLSGLDEYTRLLKQNAGEAEALYHDILINVTSFFRNPEAFDALKAEVFPAITENRSRHDAVRVWTLGCSTGEEAYSLAMAFSEFVEESGRAIPLQVFATDLNAVSIEKARSAVYARGAAADVSAERLRRFFVELDGSYRIAKPIRDACIFARHNVLEDPPFSRIDLVSCRNMLIYLGNELQQKILPILHYALRPNGYLWLGTSETIGTYRDLFELKNARNKIYAKKHSQPQPRPILGTPGTRTALVGRTAYAPQDDTKPLDTQKEVDRLLIARYAPPSVLVRDDLEIIQYRGNTAPYLTPAPGRATLNLLKMLRDGLVLPVRSAMQRARTEEIPVRQEGITIGSNGDRRKVNIEVIPVKSSVNRAEQFMVLFEEASSGEVAAPVSTATIDVDETVQESARLKQELAATREYLQSVIEQQEAANEELQSANEEVQSANEELQSINEELETSKEEVQSSNEELATVNDELQARNTELAQSNNDLMNLLSSVQMAIVMLGSNLRIRRFTPMAERLLNLIPTDVGRPMSDINLNIDVPDMDSLIAEAIDTVAEREREVQDPQGRWYLLRVRPYRTMENKIDGAVIVLIDVDSLKRSQEMLRQQTELLDRAHDAIIMWELDGYVTYWNKAAEETYGFTREQAIGRKVHELLLATPLYESYANELRRDGHCSAELVHTRRDGQKIIVESRMVAVTDTQQRKLVVQTDRAMTEEKKSEGVLRKLADSLVTADRNKDEFLAMLAHELRNPLAPLRNVVAVLRSERASATDKTRALGIVERQVQNMARLIDDLLDVSRMTLSQIEMRKTRIDIVAVVHRAAEQHESTLTAKRQSLHLDLPPARIYVEADEIRVEQIVGNLVENASKYTNAGGDVWVSVERATLAAGNAGRAGTGEAVIRVRDNGIGIESEKLSNVFDMFMRATRSIDQRYGGLGLGLTIVRRLTELHGGRVEARSEGPGKGSEFVVRFPLTSGDAESAKGVAPRVSAKAGNKYRILVVDDNVDNLEATAMSLRIAHHEVSVAENAAKALEVIAKFKPDVALIDIGLPDVDGYELAKRLRASASDGIRLIALSGYGHAEARERAQAAGFDEYLVKPAGIEQIQEALDRAGK
jgi:two-component system, chemotaxis family, CheB/CheR fusion protein